MALNKKQKKQLDVARKKLPGLHQLLAAAKKQMDDLQEVRDIEQRIADIERQIETIQASKN